MKVNFKCKDCGHVTKVKNKIAKHYYNYKCEKCGHIANKEGSATSPAIIWKTDPGTYPKKKYDS
jgi:uncharacterized Zn finger protein